MTTEPFTISAKKVNTNTGISNRQRSFDISENKHRANNNEYRLASDAIAAARTKTTDFDNLLQSFIVRGSHFRTIYAFYSKPRIAIRKFLNFQAMQSTMSKLVISVCVCVCVCVCACVCACVRVCAYVCV